MCTLIKQWNLITNQENVYTFTNMNSFISVSPCRQEPVEGHEVPGEGGSQVSPHDHL